MSVDSLHLHNTQALMNGIADRHPLNEGDVLVVLVHQPALDQRILDITRLPVGADVQPTNYEEERELSDLLCEHMRSLPIPPRDVPLRAETTTIALTVIVRRGYNVWTQPEKTWAMAWRYSNHCTNAFDEDIIVVTEHGWTSLYSDAAGRTPRLERTVASL